MRSSDKNVYLDSDFDAPNTRMFKSIGPVEFTTIYFGSGPVEKYQINGYSRTTNWVNGQPKTDADYIVCAQIQVVYSGVNVNVAEHLRPNHVQLTSRPGTGSSKALSLTATIEKHPRQGRDTALANRCVHDLFTMTGRPRFAAQVDTSEDRRT